MQAHTGLLSVPLSEEQCSHLRGRRNALRLTQQKLAERVGCSTRTILRLENAQWSVSPKLLSKICGVLGMQWDIEIRVRLLPARKRPQKRVSRVSVARRKRKRA